jgi:hypothetical protein
VTPRASGIHGARPKRHIGDESTFFLEKGMSRYLLLLIFFVLPTWAAAAEVFINPKDPSALNEREKEELRRYQMDVVQFLNQNGIDFKVVRRGGNLGLEPKNKTADELIAIINKKIKKDGKNLEVSTTNRLPTR